MRCSAQAMADTDEAKSPPPGFSLSASRGPFTLHNGPVYRAQDDLRSGLWVLKRHCNSMGFLHGGMASAFADGALAWAVWDEVRAMSVTLKLTLSYMDIVPEGAWLEARPEVTARSGDIVHVTADLVRDGKKLTARADGVFRALRRKGV